MNYEANCDYILPDSSKFSFRTNRTIAEYTGFGLVPSPAGHLYNVSLGDKAYIANFFALGYSMNSLTPTNFSAYECALWWSVNAYQVSTQGSVQSTNIVYTQDILDASGYTSNSTKEFSRGSPGNEIMFHNLTFPPFPADVQSRLNLSETAATIEYRLMTISLVALRMYTKSVIQGTGFLESHATSASNDIVEAVWYAASSLTSMESWISRVALSLSNYIRDPSPSTFVAVGSQTRAEFAGNATILGMVVRWPWFVLPVVIVALSIILLVAIMVQSANSSVGVWKGSWLMYLFCELSPDVKNLIKGERLGIGRLTWEANNGKEDKRGAMSVADFVRDLPVRLTQKEDGAWIFEASQV